MEKVYTYLTLAVMISFFFFISGVGTEGNSFSIIQSIMAGDITSSTLWIKIAVVLGIISGGVIAAVLVGNASTGIAIGSITMSYFLVTFVADIVGIINKSVQTCSGDLSSICGVGYYLVAFICIPIAAGFAWSLFELVAGSNN